MTWLCFVLPPPNLSSYSVLPTLSAGKPSCCSVIHILFIILRLTVKVIPFQTTRLWSLTHVESDELGAFRRRHGQHVWSNSQLRAPQLARYVWHQRGIFWPVWPLWWHVIWALVYELSWPVRKGGLATLRALFTPPLSPLHSFTLPAFPLSPFLPPSPHFLSLPFSSSLPLPFPPSSSLPLEVGFLDTN